MKVIPTMLKWFWDIATRSKALTVFAVAFVVLWIYLAFFR